MRQAPESNRFQTQSKWAENEKTRNVMNFYYVIKPSKLRLITYFCYIGSWCRRTSQSERCWLSFVKDLLWQGRKVLSCLPMKNTWSNQVPNWKKSMKSSRTKMDFCTSSMPRRTSTVEHKDQLTGTATWNEIDTRCRWKSNQLYFFNANWRMTFCYNHTYLLKSIR